MKRSIASRRRNALQGTGAFRRGSPAVLVVALLLMGLTPLRANASDPCNPVVNAIACENSKPGTPSSQWDLALTGSDDGSGSGDLSIQGFATDMSVDVGQTVHFKISTVASSYHLDIYRMGYYQGLGARLITTVSPSVSLPQTQPNCLFDSATRLTDCGNWAESASWSVPSDAVSGIYFAKVIRDDTGGASHIFFVVRDDGSRSDILVQTSDETWQAYNRYGGYSLYYPSGSRAYKVSYNRPFTTRGYADESFVFSAEYPMVRWLESNGYDLSYFSEVDTARYGSELLQHKVFMSSGHDEYWSGDQRANVEAARSAGVNLAFFSGNEIFWKTRWESSIDGSSTNYRTLVCYKETQSNAKIDPSSQWTGTWRDGRFSPPSDGGRPENVLTGTLYTVNCCTQSDQQTYSITVPADDGKMRFWRNTSVATLSPGQTATLPPGTLGYEWDENVDNGVQPGGVVALSTTTKDVLQHLIDYGNTYVAGTATHHLSLYKTAGGALVFGAGTIRWAWGLDSHHDSSSSIEDVRMQQATVNLLADMHSQPSTLQPGLVSAGASTDTAAPTSIITSPTAGTVIKSGLPVTVTGTATDAGGGVVGSVEVSVDGGTTWHPATGRATWSYTWFPTTPATAIIRSRATDDSGNMETPSAGVSISVTGRSCPCTIWPPTATPASISSASTATELGVKFQTNVAGSVTGIRFYKAATNTGTHVGHLWTRTGTLLATATFTNESASGWQDVAFSSPVTVNAGTTYVASYSAPNGHFGQDVNYFASAGAGTWPLMALRNGVDGSNGVYRSGTGFPNLSYASSNYWVDLDFVVQPPPQPTGVTATALSPSQIRLSWTDVTGESNFRVERSPDGSANWTPVAWPAQNITSYTDTGLSPSTLYYYRVVASNTGGDSTPSAVVSATTNPTAPPAPTDVDAVPTSATSIDVSWTDQTGESSQTSYEIQRSADGFTGWQDVGTTDPGVKTFSDTGLSSTSTYYYQVIATNVTGSSPPSEVASATTFPDAPTGLTATAPSSSEIDLSWSDVSGEIGFRVQRSPDGSTEWSGVGTTSQGVTTFSDTGLSAATTFYYRVIAEGAGGDSAPSNIASATTKSSGTAPPAPTGVTATGVSGSEIDVAWNDVIGEDGYSVQRSPDGLTNWTPIGTTNQDVTTYSDTGLPSGTFFWYRVIATSQLGNSDPSASASATTKPATPGGLTSASPSSSEIDLSWNDVIGETSFRVERSPSGTSNWASVGTPAQNVTSFADTGLSSGTTWFYRVIAINSAGESPPTSAVSGTTRAAAPTGLAVTATWPAEVDLSWNDVTGETGYRVERSPNGSSSWTSVGTPAQNATSFSDTSTSGSTAYWYRIIATNPGGDSGASNVVTTTTQAYCPCSVWPGTTTPGSISGATTSNELGVKFRADYTGYIMGIRFYKGPGNTGTHVGHLWTRTGTLLATATFTNETATGWQQVNFATPVAVTAGTTYVASYFAPNGHYAADTSYFATAGVDKAPLHALQNGIDGPNGVYKDSSAFPNLTYKSTNYWVDVVFTTQLGPSNLTATGGPSRVDLAWTDVNGETGYKVQRSPDGVSNWTLVGTTEPNVTSFGDTGLQSGTTYYYRVIASSRAGDSQPSPVASGTAT